MSEVDRDKFMYFYRSDQLETLSVDDRIEVFLGILTGSSDITKELLDTLLSDYGEDTLSVVHK